MDRKDVFEEESIMKRSKSVRDIYSVVPQMSNTWIMISKRLKGEGESIAGYKPILADCLEIERTVRAGVHS